MLLSILLILLGIVIIYFLIEFFLVCGANINTFGEKWVKKTLWIWLPIYGIFRLTKEVIFRKK